MGAFSVGPAYPLVHATRLGHVLDAPESRRTQRTRLRTPSALWYTQIPRLCIPSRLRGPTLVYTILPSGMLGDQPQANQTKTRHNRWNTIISARDMPRRLVGYVIYILLTEETSIPRSTLIPATEVPTQSYLALNPLHAFAFETVRLRFAPALPRMVEVFPLAVNMAVDFTFLAQAHSIPQIVQVRGLSRRHLQSRALPHRMIQQRTKPTCSA